MGKLLRNLRLELNDLNSFSTRHLKCAKNSIDSYSMQTFSSEVVFFVGLNTNWLETNNVKNNPIKTKVNLIDLKLRLIRSKFKVKSQYMKLKRITILDHIEYVSRLISLCIAGYHASYLTGTPLDVRDGATKATTKQWITTLKAKAVGIQFHIRLVSIIKQPSLHGGTLAKWPRHGPPKLWAELVHSTWTRFRARLLVVRIIFHCHLSFHLKPYQLLCQSIWSITVGIL